MDEQLLRFGDPRYLALIGAVPILVFAYLRRREARAITVSSLLILKHLTRKVSRRRRFKPPLTFFLELLALLLLAAAAAAPLLRGAEKNFALIIDTTMSMAASSEQGSRIELARRRISEWLTIEDERTARYTVYSSAPLLTQQGEQGLSAREAIALTQQLTPTITSDSLDSQALELAQSGEFDTVVIISDRQWVKENSPAREMNGGETEILALPVGTPVANLFISQFTVGSPGLDTASLSAEVTVSQAGPPTQSPATTNATVVLERVDGVSAPPIQIGSIAVTVNSDSPRLVVFPLPTDLPRGAFLRSRLIVDSKSNALAEDDIAWATNDRRGTQSWLLIRPEANHDSLGLEKVGPVSISALSPEEYARLSTEELKSFALLIFDRTSPVVPPQNSTLLIVPPERNSLFPTEGIAENPEITSWIEDHQITSYLKLPLLDVQTAVIFRHPLAPWVKAVVNAEAGPIVVAGESQGFRFAATGFQLLPFEGLKTPVVSVLTLNLLGWLTSDQAFSPSYITGASVRLDSAKTWIIRKPDGVIEQLEETGEHSRTITLEKPGVYGLTGISGKTRDSITQTERTIVANVFLPEESETIIPQDLILPEHVPLRRLSSERTTHLWPKVLACILALLVGATLLSYLPRSKVANAG